MKHHLLLVDLSNLLMRIYWRTADKRAASVSTLTVQAIKGAVRQQKATLCVAALDPLDGECLGYSVYPDYKLKDTNDGGPSANELTNDVWPYLDEAGICMAEKSGYEADHIIATLTANAARKGTKVSILSKDRDLFALVRDGVSRCLYPEKGQEAVIREADVRARLGVAPSQVTDLKILAGDQSDNIPRLGEWDRSAKPYGFTEKRAAALLNEYADVAGVYRNMDKLPSREQKWLEVGRDDLTWRRDLIRLRANVELEVSPKEARVENLGISFCPS